MPLGEVRGKFYTQLFKRGIYNALSKQRGESKAKEYLALEIPFGVGKVVRNMVADRSWWQTKSRLKSAVGGGALIAAGILTGGPTNPVGITLLAAGTAVLIGGAAAPEAIVYPIATAVAMPLYYGPATVLSLGESGLRWGWRNTFGRIGRRGNSPAAK